MLTRRIIGSAVDVHRILGPGLLESVYRTCLVHEMEAQGLRTRCEASDVIVEDRVLLELKAVDTILAIHEAQLLTYLKLSSIRVGLLVNFNVTRLQLGIRRFVR